ncbi:MAG: hypothetical protein COU10_03145 [Candidatus Harrisonbacteria bacterium CG10_big_fil_rev_8_21_14_0_10_45_28]|uniref:Type II secretion system protein GspG C-terminal domain-containing protein n=1 Tax=Candidatus Harrisonbacteria bacterium CG10_big_fil_rev_8_21_14_0_10_45_28 TaxID=1974586 RepID=A0A2H0UMQ5_9BACT|nr:MAG: hypothetical protein COU10_03145 [Candidatus Harrisonbacteria bacterium CG10_big_fil_rev_8_21_14_0_10_45_28]
MKNSKKGFTLIELLVTIGILAVLATVVVLVLNPAELFRQARDGQRISDLSTTRDAINLYLTVDSTPTIASAGPFSTSNATCSFTTCTVRNVYTVTNGGWVAIDLTDGGALQSSIATLPRDPTNSAIYQYSYKGNTSALTFELDGRLESVKHRDLMTTDGGDKNTCSSYTEATCYFETGSNLAL